MNLPNTFFIEAYNSHQSGDLMHARKLYEKALGINPGHSDALFFLSKIYATEGRLNEALSLIKRAVKANPKNPFFYAALGQINSELMNIEDAINAFQSAITFDPSQKDAYVGLGHILHTQGQLEESLHQFKIASSLEPTDLTNLFNIAVILQEQKKYLDALKVYKQILTQDANSVYALNNMGLIYSSIDQIESAIECHQKAIAIDPAHAESYNNLGYLYQELMQQDQALEHFDQAIRLQSDYPEARWNRSTLLLTSGKYDEGFQEYEWRLQLHDLKPRIFEAQRWTGEEDLRGKTILIHSEQGLGDVIQFSRYINLFSELGAKVLLEVQKPLMSILRSLKGDITLLEQGHPLPRTDFECPIMSLALAFKTDVQNIPFSGAYLESKPNLVDAWAKKLGPKKAPRIGIVWSSVSSYADDRKRSMSLDNFLRCLPESGLDYICLQKTIKTSDLKALKENPQIQFFGDQLNDFEDTAALIENVDLVVSTCTSVPHLSGALGIPTWIIVPYKPDWRWLTETSKSPWYTNTKIYRQEKYGDWTKVLELVKQDLNKLINF
jgi:tetratricopeptide (TPR) repeat protein